MSLRMLPTASPEQMCEIALFLHNLSAKTVQGFNAEKVFPQFNREKSLFAYACQKLFQGRKDLTPDEIQQARDFVRPFDAGFRQLLSQLQSMDVYLSAKMQSESFNSKLFFERSQAIVTFNGTDYQLGIKRYFVPMVNKETNEQEQKLVTAIVFMPIKSRTNTLGTPAATKPNLAAMTPQEAIAQGNVPVVANGVYAEPEGI